LALRDLRSDFEAVAQSLTEVQVPSALRNAGIILGGTLLAAICAHVVLPLYFTPVPLSLQPFAVLLLGLLLSPRLAAATFVTYLAEGAMGLPVFAPGADLVGGLAHLFGPTGGYLLAYPAAAAIISVIWRRARRGFAAAVFAAAAGDLLILASGALWLSIWTHASTPSALVMAIYPFLPGDALKVAAAAGAALAFVRIRRRTT
jgi:biotin transport system substrate-specific component